VTPESKPAGPGAAAAAGESPPRLPVRASIYIDPDGTVHFGALFADLVPVARSLGADESSGQDLASPDAAAPAGSLGSDR
jgi:hypothetical protein